MSEPRPSPRLPRAAHPSLLAELKSLAARSGEAFGAAYARAARTVLLELEQIEDANAERRYHERARRTRSVELLARTTEPQTDPSSTVRNK